MGKETIRVVPWEAAEAPSEADLRRRMETEGLEPYTWSNGPGDVYGAHDHRYYKVIYVVAGSITFSLPAEGRRLDLKAGDRLELPPRVPHNAVVGPQGVICLEAHK